MMIAWTVVGVALVYGGYRLASDYVRRSMSSFAGADRAWRDLNAVALKLVSGDVPESVALGVVKLAAIAGCGCFVRGVLLMHYLPRVVKRAKDSQWEKTFDDLEELAPEQRGDFHQLIAMVFIYDSYRNPLQGWLFRRTMRSFSMPPQPSFSEKVEAQLAAFSVLSARAVGAR